MPDEGATEAPGTPPHPRHARRPQPDESDASHVRLVPGVHALPGRAYSRVVGHAVVWTDPEMVGDPLAGGTGNWGDPLVDGVLGAARVSKVLSESTIEVLPWALGIVVACTPDALGLVGPSAYSGPRATSLVGTLTHSSRAEAYAAELIVAAALTYRAWPSITGGVALGAVRSGDGRLDFGVKLTSAIAGRSTAEADILITSASGLRYGVDVKYSVRNVVATVPSEAMLRVIDGAITRGEIESFHFVTPHRFAPAFRRTVVDHPGIHLHEHVWPTARDVQRIRLQRSQRIAHNAIFGQYQAKPHAGWADIGNALLEAYGDAYASAFGQNRDLRLIRVREHEHLFDTTDDHSPDAPAPRLVAIRADRRLEPLTRNKNFMRRFPIPEGEYDRGHLVAREAGGAEGIGLNLIPQRRRLNRGQGRDGRSWRKLERLNANADVLVVNRAIYDDPTDIPAWIEVVQVHTDGTATVARLPNRTNLP